MLIDNVTLKTIAGKGGVGAVAFAKTKMTLGPTGGSGGKGGDVYFEAVADLGALRRFRAKKVFMAEDGRNGRPSFRDGHDGEDMILLVPRGTVIHNYITKETVEMTKIGERFLAVSGGKGGRGNYQFKSARNPSPEHAQPGLPGEKFTFHLELKLIADIGLIGLPNVGKSSFLNEVTNANSRVANYAFTTLEPHLGVYENLVLADIPGIIEGASTGKGLGIKFLRHIERTGILFHFIEATTQDPVADYKAIRKELGAYNPLLLEKEEYLFVSKTDLVDEKRVKEILKLLKPLNKNLSAISIHDMDRMTAVRKVLDKIQVGITKTKPVEEK